MVNTQLDCGKFNKGNSMDKATFADIGTAFILYQAVLEILSDEAVARLDKVRDERFNKFKPKAQEIDAQFVSQARLIEENCEKFCMLALDGIMNMLEQHFPTEDAPE
jgi:hypothetical protein